MSSRTGSSRSVCSLEVTLAAYARRWFGLSSVKETISRTPEVMLSSSGSCEAKVRTMKLTNILHRIRKVIP